MGLLDRLTDKLRDHAGELGELPVPGKLKTRLPAGKVMLTYRTEASAVGGSMDSRAVAVPKSLKVTVTPVGSKEPLAHEGSQKGASSTSGNGWSQRGFGHVEVPAAGEYEIEASPISDEELADRSWVPHKDPKVLLGP